MKDKIIKLVLDTIRKPENYRCSYYTDAYDKYTINDKYCLFITVHSYQGNKSFSVVISDLVTDVTLTIPTRASGQITSEDLDDVTIREIEYLLERNTDLAASKILNELGY